MYIGWIPLLEPSQTRSSPRRGATPDPAAMPDPDEDIPGFASERESIVYWAEVPERCLRPGEGGVVGMDTNE